MWTGCVGGRERPAPLPQLARGTGLPSGWLLCAIPPQEPCPARLLTPPGGLWKALLPALGPTEPGADRVWRGLRPCLGTGCGPWPPQPPSCARSLKLGSAAFPRADLAALERSVGRLHSMHSKMLMDIEKVQIHYGGSVKASSQMIRELLQAQCLSSPCYKR